MEEQVDDLIDLIADILQAPCGGRRGPLIANRDEILSEPFPDGDVVVMHKLMIEANEEEYLQKANQFAPSIISRHARLRSQPRRSDSAPVSSGFIVPPAASMCNKGSGTQPICECILPARKQ